MLREHVSLIRQFGCTGTHSEEVKAYFIQLTSIDGLRKRITSAVEIEAHGWTLKEFDLGNTTATMAYNGETVRCLSIKVGQFKPASVLASSFDEVEARFNEWASQVISEYIDRSIEGVDL